MCRNRRVTRTENHTGRGAGPFLGSPSPMTVGVYYQHPGRGAGPTPPAAPRSCLGSGSDAASALLLLPADRPTPSLDRTVPRSLTDGRRPPAFSASPPSAHAGLSGPALLGRGRTPQRRKISWTSTTPGLPDTDSAAARHCRVSRLCAPLCTCRCRARSHLILHPRPPAHSAETGRPRPGRRAAPPRSSAQTRARSGSRSPHHPAVARPGSRVPVQRYWFAYA
jgi:hypothetical protein